MHDTTKWLKKAVRNLDNLRNLDITIGLWCPFDTESVWPESPHSSELQKALQDMSSIPKLRTLRIYSCQEDSYEADEIAEYGNKYATWTKEDGWKAGVTEAEQESSFDFTQADIESPSID